VYLPGFVALVAANYFLGLMAAGPHRRLAVTLAVIVDLGVLGVFKYIDFALGAGTSILSVVTGAQAEAPLFRLVLPLAISFVTFTMLAYVIDIGRGGQPERSPLRFSLFVTFFPHLISGPIMRAHEFLPQVRHPRPWSSAYLASGVPLLVGGLFKKTLGDQLSPYVLQIFGAPDHFGSLGLWLGALAFAFQIYFDFSGYTDMALGSAALLGFRLPRNFDWPYRALSIQEFWRRWHMTLSRWLRDYLYIPLGGSRHGTTRTYFALMATMALGGLWHGAGLTFVLWGVWHGLGLSVHRWWRTRNGSPHVPVPVAWGMTFGFVLLGWVLFRAANIEDATTYLRAMFVPHGGPVGIRPEVLIILLVSLVAQLPRFSQMAIRVAPPGTFRRYAICGTALAGTVLILPIVHIQFIYFQF
jgi:alginate O-acetyltransferase complex protein AlgI